MFNRIWGAIALAVGALLPMQVLAQPILTARCTVDSLSTNAAAAARVEWARKCGTLQNVGDPAAFFNTGQAAAGGGTLKDYLEADPEKNPEGEGAFTGPDYLFKMNTSAMMALYLSGPTYQTTDLNGYFQWSRDSWRRKGRQLYPTFSTSSDITSEDNIQLFPHKNLEDCMFYLDKESTQPVFTPSHVNGYCEAACYTPEQKILFSSGEVPILDAMNSLRDDLITLTPDSTLDNLRLHQNSTYSYTRELRDAEQKLCIITTQSGGRLSITLEHPVINGEGRIVQAQTLKVGDELVKADGTLDPIVDIQRTTYFGKVYNIAPVSTDLVSNILVAQGYLVGSVRFQNDEVRYINRIILYGVPTDVIP
ncbi:Hint domain-containing protein [Hyalangium minutum]|uniref:Putative cell surface protein n=1 Tax=Hyalangium minutum TaxID=394096 RepID=A0A085VU02_9BACT|nr:Hint domain-containing protein [Hyalangium minutum]KFE58915.1 putative cell surface protein [Hyalangium minutum]